MVVLFAALLLLSRWITRHMQGIGYLLSGDGHIALVLYFLLMLPGVLVHELCHVLTAWLLRVPVRRFSIGLRQKGRGDRVSLGSVDIADADALRSSLIGLAPLIGGCAIILLIGRHVADIDSLPPFGDSGSWSGVRLAYGTPDFWLWVYLLLAVGNAMLPSAADRSSWGIALGFVGFVGAALHFSGLLGGASATISRWAAGAASLLSYAFAATVAVDLLFAVLLLIIEGGLALIGFGRVEYD
jgi:membrane-associated protease RseP (regulator of RpoE activity)